MLPIVLKKIPFSVFAPLRLCVKSNSCRVAYNQIKIISMEEITNFLINKMGMRKVSERTNSDTEVDWNKFSCVLRTGDIHYLFWSEQFKHFSIGVRHENPKGEPGTKGKRYWSYTIIPKVIDTIEKASALVDATVDKNALKLFCQ